MLQAAAADELVGQQHTTEVGVLAGTLVEDQLVQEDNAVYTLASHIHTHIAHSHIFTIKLNNEGILNLFQ